MLNPYMFSSFDGDAANIIASFSVPPSSARATLINNLVVALKSGGIWSRLQLFYIHAAHDSQAARVNWISPGVDTLTVVGAPTFTTDRGWTGDGVDDCLDASTAFSSMANFLQDNAHLAVWSRSNLANANYYDCGTTAAVNSCRLQVKDATSFVFNVNAATIASVANASAIGFHLANRSGSAATQGYKNGTNVVTDTDVSSAVNAGAFTILRNRTSFSARELASSQCGLSLDATQNTALYSALSTYMTAVGA